MLPTEITKCFRVHKGKKFALADYDPKETCGLDIEKAEAKELLAAGVKRLAKLQEKLYAEHRWSILVIVQGLDTAGKDGVIKHVMSGVNPQGCEVHSFKVPSQIELDHDFLWRSTIALPRRGHIGIFNRSYYEEVLVVRVHKELLDKQNLPPQLITKNIWNERYEDINAFERHLLRNGTVPIKFFLNVSKKEQKKRLLARLDHPEKQWKFNPGDVEERRLWDQLTTAYDDMIAGTATDEAPWHVIPADNKWFTRLAVAAAIVERIEAIDPKYPALDDKAKGALEAARVVLSKE
jgi:PPK2 family polyphosphate:nucleotide phosphotransferase